MAEHQYRNRALGTLQSKIGLSSDGAMCLLRRDKHDTPVQSALVEHYCACSISCAWLVLALQPCNHTSNLESACPSIDSWIYWNLVLIAGPTSTFSMHCAWNFFAAVPRRSTVVTAAWTRLESRRGRAALLLRCGAPGL